MPACISAAIRVTVAFPVPTGRAVCRMPVPAARKPVQHPLARPRALVGLDRSSKLCRSVPRTFFDTIYTTYIGTVNALTNLVGTRLLLSLGLWATIWAILASVTSVALR